MNWDPFITENITPLNDLFENAFRPIRKLFWKIPWKLITIIAYAQAGILDKQ